MATEGDSKKLCDLRVVDLRAELEKRGLDKTGVKASLIERLQKVLIAEGENPDEYLFDLSDKKPTKRLSTSNRADDSGDTGSEQAVNDSVLMIDTTPILENTFESSQDLNDKKDDNMNAESPLNLSIGEEEETLLLNSGDEMDTSEPTPVVNDEKTTASNKGGAGSDSSSGKQPQNEQKRASEDAAKGAEDGTDEGAKDGEVGDVDEEDEQLELEEEEREREESGEKRQRRDTETAQNVDNETSSINREESTAKSSDSVSVATTTAATTATSAPAVKDSAGTGSAAPAVGANIGGATATSASSSANANTTTDSTAAASENGGSKSDKEKNKNGKGNPGRSLWVTNLLPSTRAQELKHLLSRYGKVIGAKVVQSSRYPRTRCYGYVTMETRAAADLCIEKLNNTELKGQIIRVAKVRPEHSLPANASKSLKNADSVDKSKRKTPPKQTATSDKDKKKSTTTTEPKKDDKSKKESKEPDKDASTHQSRSSSRKDRSLSKSSLRRPERKADILTFDKIREERERQRQRDRERAMREEEKRRREIQRAREIEKRQREEAMRLEREREKLRAERERLDRQRVEIIRLERERQRLEREKLEQEKQELRRQQMRLEEARRPIKRPSSTSASTYRRGESGGSSYNDDRSKRIVTERHYDETPPPPRFEVSAREAAPEIVSKKEIGGKDYKSRLAYSKRTEEYSKRGEFNKREYSSAERHTSGGHPGHMVHNIPSGNNSSKYESSSYVNRDREREIREQRQREPVVPIVPPPRISKEARYSDRSNERSPVSYRPVRDERERRPVSEHHAKADIRSSREHRYPEPPATIKEMMDNPFVTYQISESARYRDSNSWHSSGASPVKPFGGMSASAGSSREPWSKSDNWRPMEGSSSNERWVGNSSSRILMSGSSVPNAMYSGGSSTISGIGTGLSCPPPPGNASYSMDRFDNYKSMSNSRKY